MYSITQKSQVSSKFEVRSHEKADFIVDGRYVIEIGGRSKNFSQISNLADSFLAIDEIDVGMGNRIPLWLFGFLY